ncbi:MAG: O-antigen ligase family protein [Terracidiphilus sp.]
MGATANPAHIGKGQVIGLAMLLLLCWPYKQPRMRALILLVCIPWLALGMVSAETRGPLFSLVFVLLLSYFFPAMRSPLISRRQMTFAVVALMGAVMLLSMFWFYGSEASRFRSKSDELVTLVQDMGEAHGTAVMRLTYYRGAFDAWLERPLLGWGVGGWSMVFWQQDFRQYPHNLFFEVMVEQGLAGIAALMFFLITVLRQLRANLAATSELFPALLPCLIYLLSIAMFSGDLDDDRFIWFWCGMTLVGCELVRRAERTLATRGRDHNLGCLAVDAVTDQRALGN